MNNIHLNIKLISFPQHKIFFKIIVANNFFEFRAVDTSVYALEKFVILT